MMLATPSFWILATQEEITIWRLLLLNLIISAIQDNATSGAIVFKNSPTYSGERAWVLSNTLLISLGSVKF